MPANNLAVLVPTLISTIQETARNQGFLFNLVTRDQRLDAAAKGQTIDFPALPDVAAVDVTPGPTVPDTAGFTGTKTSLTLSQQKAGRFNLDAEDERGLAELGPNYRFEALNLAVASVIDAACGHLQTVMEQGAGGAFGTPGTDPFASNPNILADIQKDLADDKSPDAGRLGVLSTLDYASASKLTQFQRLNEAPRGTDFAAGRLGMLSAFNIGYDQQVGVSHATTAAGGYLVNFGAGYAAGTTSIEVDTGTGSFAPGDVITIAGNVLPGTATLAQMVVRSFTGTTLVLTRGLRSAVADNAGITRIATHTASYLGHQSATYFTFRPSATLTGGDAATVDTVVRDPVTGLAMRLAYYPGYHRGIWEVSAVYGAVVRRPQWLRKLIR